MDKKIKVSKNDIFSIHKYGLECMNCHEIIEFEDKNVNEVKCKYCESIMEFQNDKI